MHKQYLLHLEGSVYEEKNWKYFIGILYLYIKLIIRLIFIYNDCHIYEKSGTGTRALSAARKAMLDNLGMQWPSNPPEKRTA